MITIEEDGFVYATGEKLEVWRNQAWRDAVVIACIPDRNEALIEYHMPNGTSALNVLDLTIPVPWEADYRTVSYANVPKYWLRAVVEQGGSWKGTPQQVPARFWPMKQADELLNELEV